MYIEKSSDNDQDKIYDPNRRLDKRIKLVLETQGDVNKMYAFFNWTAGLKALNIDTHEYCFKQGIDASKIREDLKAYIDFGAMKAFHEKLVDIQFER